MYRIGLSLFVLIGLSAGAGAQDAVMERDDAGEIAGHYDSLNVAFRSAVDGGDSAVAEIAANGKLFTVRLEQGRIQQLDIVPLRQDAPKLKSREDSERLAALYRRLIQDFDHRRSNVRVLLRFTAYLVEVFPENTGFGGLVRDPASMPAPQAATPLCDNRGVLTQGQYSPRLNPFDLETEFAIVGDPVSDCLGRCGIACLQFESGGQFLTPARAYTQGCFDHDLCAGFTGDSLGNCTDEFLIASDDYLLGPNCDADITGTWEVIAYRNENQIQEISRATVVFFADGTLSVVNGATGTWRRTTLHFEFSVGARRFFAYGSARDLVLEGRMDEADTPVGYWTGVHLTTGTETP
jgi:hypothetical protein